MNTFYYALGIICSYSEYISLALIIALLISIKFSIKFSNKLTHPKVGFCAIYIIAVIVGWAHMNLWWYYLDVPDQGMAFLVPAAFGWIFAIPIIVLVELIYYTTGYAICKFYDINKVKILNKRIAYALILINFMQVIYLCFGQMPENLVIAIAKTIMEEHFQLKTDRVETDFDDEWLIMFPDINKTIRLSRVGTVIHHH